MMDEIATQGYIQPDLVLQKQQTATQSPWWTLEDGVWRNVSDKYIADSLTDDTVCECDYCVQFQVPK